MSNNLKTRYNIHDTHHESAKKSYDNGDPSTTICHPSNLFLNDILQTFIALDFEEIQFSRGFSSIEGMRLWVLRIEIFQA